MSNGTEVSWCSKHHNVTTLEIEGPCFERGKPCSLCEIDKLRAAAPAPADTIATPNAAPSSKDVIGATRYRLTSGHSDDAGLGGEGYVVRMSDHFPSFDTAQKWVKAEDYESLRLRFEKACARVTELESAVETSGELEQLREEVRKYKAWAASCDPSPPIQAAIAELEALEPPVTDSALRWVRDHCLGLLRGQLTPECEWCKVGIPLSADGRRHDSIYGVWACSAVKST